MIYTYVYAYLLFCWPSYTLDTNMKWIPKGFWITFKKYWILAEIEIHIVPIDLT